jgi:glycosyltransferase involved in cell wall biosynthesis
MCIDNSVLKISIIIPAFNEERLLGRTLAQINSVRPAFTRAGFETELIVCDNNSTDHTAEIARAAGATVVFESVNQIARARNRGASVAGGDWLLFIDADSWPTAELFTEVGEQIRSGKCLAGGVTVKLEAGYPLASVLTEFWNFASRLRRWAAGSFIFCETAAFRKIGGFSNELFAGEELDLSKRLHVLARESNRKIVILHRHPLITSARRVRNYSFREMCGFFLRAGMRPNRVLRSREACSPWYDGRR